MESITLARKISAIRRASARSSAFVCTLISAVSRETAPYASSVAGFTPTRDFNADDVVWSFERQWKADHPYAKVSGGKYDYFADMGLPDDLQTIEKVDPLTVKITLKRANVTMLANLAMDFAASLFVGFTL